MTLGLASASATLLPLAFFTPDAAEPSTLYATTETLLTLFALGAAWLLRRRFLRTRRRSDLLLAVAVIVFGLVHLIACAVPAALSLPVDGYLSEVDLCGQVLAYTLIAFAAFASHESLLVGVRRTDAVLAAAGATLVGIAAGAAYVMKPELIGTGVSEGSPTSHPLMIVLIGAAVGLLVAACAGFARNAHAGRRPGQWSFAWAAALMAAAVLSQLNGAYALGYDSAADALRLIGFGLMVGAGYRWELQVRRVAARAAAAAERQRVARDLHDGLAQDLAFIAAHSERMAADLGAEHPVVTAARRALQISRCAIAELSDPHAANVHEALEATSSELRARFGIAISLDVQLINELSAEVQEDINRIVREAIANAVRHGDACTVVVSLHEQDGHIKLRVQDDGRGIEAACKGQHREGFGLRSIRDRAAGRGGQMRLSQEGPRGTVLYVVLP